MLMHLAGQAAAAIDWLSTQTSPLMHTAHLKVVCETHQTYINTYVCGKCFSLLHQERDFLPVLLALARLARDKAEPNPEGGAPLVTEPKRIAGIGLVDAPVEAVTAAVSITA
jgi:hypothetical protein